VGVDAEVLRLQHGLAHDAGKPSHEVLGGPTARVLFQDHPRLHTGKVGVQVAAHAMPDRVALAAGTRRQIESLSAEDLDDRKRQCPQSCLDLGAVRDVPEADQVGAQEFVDGPVLGEVLVVPDLPREVHRPHRFSSVVAELQGIAHGVGHRHLSIPVPAVHLQQSFGRDLLRGFGVHQQVGIGAEEVVTLIQGDHGDVRDVRPRPQVLVLLQIEPLHELRVVRVREGRERFAERFPDSGDDRISLFHVGQVLLQNLRRIRRWLGSRCHGHGQCYDEKKGVTDETAYLHHSPPFAETRLPMWLSPILVLSGDWGELQTLDGLYSQKHDRSTKKLD